PGSPTYSHLSFRIPAAVRQVLPVSHEEPHVLVICVNSYGFVDSRGSSGSGSTPLCCSLFSSQVESCVDGGLYMVGRWPCDGANRQSLIRRSRRPGRRE